jgi:hypothetical protein
MRPREVNFTVNGHDSGFVWRNGTAHFHGVATLHDMSIGHNIAIFAHKKPRARGNTIGLRRSKCRIRQQEKGDKNVTKYLHDGYSNTKTSNN